MNGWNYEAIEAEFDKIERRLKLGANSKMNGYEHMDIDATLRPEFIHDITKPFPMKDETYDEIFADNILEHIEPKLLQKTIINIHEKLKVGGKLIVLIPYISYPTYEYHYFQARFGFLNDFVTDNYFVEEYRHLYLHKWYSWVEWLVNIKGIRTIYENSILRHLFQGNFLLIHLIKT